MTRQNAHDRKNSAGNTLVIALVIVIILAGAGWFFIQKGNKNLSSMPAPQETAETQSTTVTEMPAAPEEAKSSTPATIDVAAATSVRALGDPKAPVKIVEYFSLTCSHCAHFHNDILPELKTKYIDTGKVYLEFQEFPLNDPALKASITARCLPEGKYEGFISLLFKSLDRWTAIPDYMPALRQNAKLAGMSDEMFDACQASAPLKLKIAEGMQIGKDKWKIDSTPTFIINDGAERISGAQPLTEFERLFRKVTNNAVGEAAPVQ